MADTGRRREREIVAGFEVALTRCVNYCLHHFYPLHHINAFEKEFLRDWSLNSFSVWAGNIDDGFVLLGKTVDVSGQCAQNKNVSSFNTPLRSTPCSSTVSERHVASSRKVPSASRLLELGKYVEDRTFRTCRTHFLSCLKVDGFLTPLSAPALKSKLTVYQERDYGTCWLAAALNLMLHVPETRVVLWNAMNRKVPTMDDTSIEIFVRTPIGREIFNKYAWRWRQRMGNETSVLEGRNADLKITNPGGGTPIDLVRAMQDVIPGLNILVRVPHEQTVMYKCNKWLMHLSRHPNETNAKHFLTVFEAEMEYHNIVGAIVKGDRPKSTRGHTIAICMDTEYEHNRVRIHNHGVSGRELTLLQFVTTYSTKLEMILYYTKSAKRRLVFDH